MLHPAAVSQDLLKEAKSLRLIQLLTAGYDEIDLKLAAELGIPVATNGGANAWSVAEHCIALLLALYRQLPASDQSVRNGHMAKADHGIQYLRSGGKDGGDHRGRQHRPEGRKTVQIF